MPKYCYSPLPSEDTSIRLLRLKPNKDKSADIQCELFEYTLQDSSKSHSYEALSYVWGNSEKKLRVSIQNCSLKVTDNLYAALLELRNHSMERILWVDAISIDQANQEEKEHQIQIMARIYSQAQRVVVWLGEAAEQSDQALEKIRDAAGSLFTRSLDNESIQRSVIALLQRPWFRRIWVLQEAAAARNILVACGSAEIDGYAFCLGVESVMSLCNASPDLQSSIRSVAFFIRGAIFRPRGLGCIFNELCPLSELISMYHTHEATLHSDKIYALLGMSSDDVRETDLSPDYNVPWKDLLETLVRHLLCKEISVEALPERECATIRSEGYVLGKIYSIKFEATSNGRQDVGVIWRDTGYTTMETNDSEKIRTQRRKRTIGAGT